MRCWARRYLLKTRHSLCPVKIATTRGRTVKILHPSSYSHSSSPIVMPSSRFFNSSSPSSSSSSLKRKQPGNAASSPFAAEQKTTQQPQRQNNKKKKKQTSSSSSEAQLTAALNKTNPVVDVIASRCDVLFCGINPGRYSARAEHHYGNPANHFWKLLYDSNIIGERLTCEQEVHAAQRYHIGLTNIVHRPTTGSEGVSKDEMKRGIQALIQKLEQLKPVCLVLNGKVIFTSLLPKGVKWNPKEFQYGPQPPHVAALILPLSITKHTTLVVTPSSSPRVAAYQYNDKLVFFEQIKMLLEERNQQKQEKT